MQGKPDGFETVLRMGNNLGKSGQFLHHAKNGKWSGKIRTVETLSGKWEMIWKNPDIFETVLKIGNHLFLIHSENRKSGFSVIRSKTFRTRKLSGSNATLLPRFLRLR